MPTVMEGESERDRKDVKLPAFRNAEEHRPCLDHPCPRINASQVFSLGELGAAKKRWNRLGVGNRRGHAHVRDRVCHPNVECGAVHWVTV